MAVRTKKSTKSAPAKSVAAKSAAAAAVVENVAPAAEETAAVVAEDGKLKGVAADFEKRLRMLEHDLKKSESPATKDEMIALLRKANRHRGNRTGKRLKDGNSTPKPPSAYLIYSNAVRSDVQKKNPNLKMTDISKVIGQQWRGLTDAQRQPHVDKAAKLKEEYTKNKAE